MAFCLHLHLSQFLLNLWELEGWESSILTASLDDSIIGLGLIRTKYNGILKVARIQFISNDEYSKDIVQSFLSYIFNELKSNYVLLDLTYNDPEPKTTISLCKDLGLKYKQVECKKRKVLSIDHNWSDYVENKGGRFKRRFRKMEKKMSDYDITVEKWYEEVK